MKIFVKTLKGNNFPIEVQPTDYVADVKKNIETVQGSDVYPASQQMLIHQGKVLKDGTTLVENNVVEDSFVVIMLTKSKGSTGDRSAAAATSKASPSVGASRSVEASTIPAAVTNMPSGPASVPGAVPVASPPLATTPAPASSPALLSGDVYGQAASNLVAGNVLEETVQQLLDMGGGTWDRDTVIRALRAAFNNPERAVEYLYSGIPEQPEVPPTESAGAAQPTNAPSVPQQPATVPSSGPNANPLNLFPEGVPNVGSDDAAAGVLDFLRSSEQFQALRAMVHSNPEILQPMLQELGKQNPHLMRLIQEHQNDFLQLMNEPVEDEEGNVLGQLDAGMPQAIEVTPEEREAIEQLEAMGFDRATVLEVYFACNKDETLAANYLLDHMHELED